MISPDQLKESDLGNLKPLLDRIFSAHALSSNKGPGRLVSPDFLEVPAITDAPHRLERRLKEAKSDLDKLRKRCQFLEMQVQAKSNQLEHMPPLLQQALENSYVKAENIELKKENLHLRVLVKEMMQESERQSMVSRFVKKLFRWK